MRFWRSEISKLRYFHDVIRPKNEFPPTSRWCKKFSRGAMKTNKNSCESWDIGLSNALTLMFIRPLEKKCWPFFEKTVLVSTLWNNHIHIPRNNFWNSPVNLFNELTRDKWFCNISEHYLLLRRNHFPLSMKRFSRFIDNSGLYGHSFSMIWFRRKFKFIICANEL